MQEQKEGCLVSIIVPVFNVENYLDRCISSIVNQTYVNIELLLIDDGSTDGSLSNLRKWEKQDKRIKIITKQNGGLSDARNVGIDAATGAYYMFVDSDDAVNVHIVQHLLSLCEANNTKMAICGYQKFTNDSQISIQSTDTDNEKTINSYGFEKYISQYQLSSEKWIKMVTAWGKMYKRDLFDTIRFPVGRLREDEFTTYKLVDIAGGVAESDAHYYYYYQRNDSIIRSSNHNKIIDYLYALQERSMMIRAKYPNLLHDSGLWIFDQIFSQYLICAIDKFDGMEKIKEIYNSEYDFYNKIIKNKKMKYWMMYNYPNLSTKLYKIRRLLQGKRKNCHDVQVKSQKQYN